jgi:hypothetical protein
MEENNNSALFNSPADTEYMRHCSTDPKVARSIPDGVVGIFL